MYKTDNSKSRIYLKINKRQLENDYMKPGHEWWVKVGYTRHDSRKRSKQLATGSWDSTVDLATFNLPYMTDTCVQNVLKSWGYQCSDSIIERDYNSCPPGKEWFKNVTVEVVQDAVNLVTSGSVGKSKLFLRETQQKVIDEVMDLVRSNPDEEISYLIAAVMRFGKNITLLSLAKELFNYDSKRYNTFLYTSYKVFMFGSIESDANEYVDFEDLAVINLKEISSLDAFTESYSKAVSEGKAVVIIASCQTLMDNDSEKAGWIKDLSFGAVFGDELHYGGATERYEMILDMIRSHANAPIVNVALSGTPTLGLLSKYKNKFIFTEYQRQELKKNGNSDFADAISPVTFCAEFSDFRDEAIRRNEDVEVLSKITDISGVVSNGTVSQVEDLIRAIWLDKESKMCIHNILKNTKYRSVELMNGLAILPMNSKKVKEFAKIANDIQDEYVFIPTTGSNVGDEEFKMISDFRSAQNEIRRCNRDGKKTVLCTCYMNIEGVTEESWNYVVWLNNTMSTTLYWQGNGRGLSVFKNDGKAKKYEHYPKRFVYHKEHMFIFDYNFSRCLLLNDEQIRTFATQDHDASISKEEWSIVRECCPIYKFENGAFQEIPSIEKYNEMLKKATSEHKEVEFILNSLLDEAGFAEIARAFAMQGLIKIRGLKNNIVSQYAGSEFSLLGSIGEPREIAAKPARDPDQLSKSDIQKAKEMLRSILTNLPRVAFIANCYSIDEICDSEDEEVCNLIEDELKLTRDVLKQVIADLEHSRIDIFLSRCKEDADLMKAGELDVLAFEDKWMKTFVATEKETTDESISRGCIDYDKYALTF